MELTPHIESLHRDLGNAAALGDEAAREAATRLLIALDPALRITMVDLLSQAAAQLSSDLGDIAIEVRMAGREPVFSITRSHQTPAIEATVTDPAVDDSSTTRLTLRLPEGLKGRAEDAAAQQGQSLNTWIVEAVRRGLSNSSRSTTHATVGRRLTGWA